MEIKKKEKRCVVAVGSTYFDELIEALDCNEFLDALVRTGFTHLLI